MIPVILFLVGLFLLVRGADWMVTGAAGVARRFGVPSLVVGLTIVAFGTSAPELVVNLLSAWRGSGDIAIGNVVGSNIANVLLILGVTAVIAPISIKPTTAWKEIPFSLLAALVLAAFGSDVLLDGAASGVVSRAEGFALLGFFAIFLYYAFAVARSGTGEPAEAQGEGLPAISAGRATALIFVGLGCLVLGGRMVVDGAVALATLLGLSERVIGLTVVAIGTSLPELATAITATRRGQADIAVGNVVGSNIFNIFWILGLTATVRPLPFSSASVADLGVLVVASLILFAALFVGPRRQISRGEGLLFLVVYAAYLAHLAFA